MKSTDLEHLSAILRGTDFQTQSQSSMLGTKDTVRALTVRGDELIARLNGNKVSEEKCERKGSKVEVII